MSMPGFCAPLAGLSAGGIVPNPVSWSDITGLPYFGTTDTNTISGISSAIQLRAEISSFSPAGGYSGVQLFASYGSGASVGPLTVANGATLDFTVNAGDRIYFGALLLYSYTASATFTVTVKYKSAGSGTFDQTLDVFDVSLSGS